MTAPARPVRVTLLTAASVLIADQITKQWALSALADGPIDVVWTLRFRLVFNPGMAFSQGQSLGPLIGLVSMVVIIGLVVSVARRVELGPPAVIGLVVGGAAGNLADRAFRGRAWLRGEVVDFIDFQWFPVFNLADISINLGVGLLVLATILRRPR